MNVSYLFDLVLTWLSLWLENHNNLPFANSDLAKGDILSVNKYVEQRTNKTLQFVRDAGGVGARGYREGHCCVRC